MLDMNLGQVLGRPRRARGGALGALVLALALPLVGVGSAAQAGDPVGTPASARAGAALPQPVAVRTTRDLAIRVLSSRPDLVSGGDALVAVDVPTAADARRVRISLRGRDVTDRFVARGDRLTGLVRGLRLGENELVARLGDRGARLTVTDHPQGGPVFSGPQLEPWVCQSGAKDAQCDQPPSTTYLYRSTDPTKSGLQPYDPQNPPSDVADTEANGHTVPFIVRVETGYQDRDQYQISVLDQPGKAWTPARPQPQYAHRLLITHGASCGADHQTGSAPDTTGSATDQYALGRGVAVMSTALDNSGHNCNLAVQAESLLMAKEHVIELFGPVHTTIGTGCSGGSLAEQWVANAYPGLYQGILPTCSFPDAYSTATQFLDYHQLLAYFTDPSRWDAASGVAWSSTQMADVLGGPDGVANAEVSETAQFHVAVPTDACAGVTDAQRYDPETNPGGTRCTIHDAAINLLGPEEQRFWTANEKKIGRGFVRIPVDNTGVQYGLATLMAGTITPAQFVDLNAKAGGVDIDTNPTPERLDNGGSASLANAYRTGLINEANHLDRVAIIDCRGTNPGLFHDTYRAFAIRARLDREHGTHANQVIWEGPVPLTADRDCELNSYQAMERWLDAVRADRQAGTLPEKIIRDRPDDVTDRCYDGAGQQVTSDLCPAGVVLVEGTPRTVAGDAITTDTNKCRLVPLDRAAYPGITFTDAQWATLQQTFPTGVCDFTRPGVLQQPTQAWLTYQRADGSVVYGGRPMGPAPRSVTFRG